MTLQAYLNEIGLQFSRSADMSVMTVLVEWLFFLYVLACANRQERGGSLLQEMLTFRSLPYPKAALPVLAFPLVCLWLQFRYYPIAVHCMCAIALWTVYICLAYRSAWNNAVFQSCLFCLLLELGKSLSRGGTVAYLLTRYLRFVTAGNVTLVTYALFLLYVLAACALVRKKVSGRLFNDLPISPGQMAALLFPLLLYLLIRQYQSDMADTLSLETWIYIDLLQLSVAVCMLIVTTVIMGILAVQSEKNALLQERLLMEQQSRQYLTQKEAMEAVNRRYHDLKHYLTAMEAAADKADSAAMQDFIARMRAQIEPYETIQRTGNQTMDILLSQRIRECGKKQIRFIPFVDGRCLDRLEVIDLCTLFGNAMDNAVEASLRIEDPALREISLKIAGEGGLLLLQTVNYYALEPSAAGEVYRTTKSDDTLHGFGLTSIREIAERYGGSMRAEAAEGVFTLTVLIPLEDGKGRAA